MFASSLLSALKTQTSRLREIGAPQGEELREEPRVQQDVPEGRPGWDSRRRAARRRRPERSRPERRLHSEVRTYRTGGLRNSGVGRLKNSETDGNIQAKVFELRLMIETGDVEWREVRTAVQ